MAGPQEKYSAANNVVNDQSQVDLDSAEAAETAGVHKAAYVGYEDALYAYSQRSDVEPLKARRARTIGDEFNDAKFVRTTADDEPTDTDPTP